METREIPSNEWVGICSRLKKAHGTTPVTVRVRKGEGMRELVARPLADLVAHTASEDSSILISVGDPWEGYLGHAVLHPTRLRIFGSLERHEVLVIEDEDGSTTEVDFLPAD